MSRLPLHTKDENPGSGALDLAMLFMTIWVPFRETTALWPSWSLLSVNDEYPRGFVEASGWFGPNGLAVAARAAAPPAVEFEVLLSVAVCRIVPACKKKRELFK